MHATLYDDRERRPTAIVAFEACDGNFSSRNLFRRPKSRRRPENSGTTTVITRLYTSTLVLSILIHLVLTLESFRS